MLIIAIVETAWLCATGGDDTDIHSYKSGISVVLPVRLILQDVLWIKKVVMLMMFVFDI